MKKRVFALALALCMLLGMIPAVSAAGVKVLDLSEDSYMLSATGYWGSKEAWETAYTGAYRIIQSNPAATDNYLYIESGTQDVTICDLNYEGLFSGIEIGDGAVLNLTLVGTSTLKASGDSGILLQAMVRDGEEPVCSALHISGSGRLNVYGGINEDEGMAAIGGVADYQGPGEPQSAVQEMPEEYPVLPVFFSVSISGGAAVEAHGWENEVAIGTLDYDGGMAVSVTDGARLTAFGGVGGYADSLTLDDTIQLWAQTSFYGNTDAIPIETTHYTSADTRLYFSSNGWRPRAAIRDSGYAEYYLTCPGIGESCEWMLADDTLSIEGGAEKTGVFALGEERTLGSWALLQGKAKLPEVIPSEPEQGGRLFWIPDDFPFVDVTYSDWCYESVHAAWENGLIDGVTWQLFKPNASLTVAQAVKLSAALHQMQKQGAVSLRNGSAHWYDSYVSYAVSNGLIEAEYQTRTAAQMNAPVSRSEFVHILFGALLNGTEMNTVVDNAIPDVKMTDKFASEIYAFYRAGILTGSDAEGTFHPDSTIKRSEAAAILVRIYNRSARMGIRLG